MRLPIVWTIFRKEITEALRDRLTLMVVIGLPILIYPLMILSLAKLQKTQAQAEKAQASEVTIWGQPPSGLLDSLKRANPLSVAVWKGAPPTVRHDLQTGKLQPPPRLERTNQTTAASETNTDADTKDRAPEEAESALLDGARAVLTGREFGAVLILWPGFEQALVSDKLGQVSIYYDSVRPASRLARDRLVDALMAYRKDLVQAREEAHLLPAGFSQAVEIRSRNLAPTQRRAGQRLGMLLPFVLIMLSATGALYAAIDLTAGEKDRATMQTLLCAPIRSLEIVAGKFLAVWCISLISALANMASLGATVARMSATAELLTLPLSSYLLAFALLLPATFMVTSFFLAVAVLARDAKDAGNFLGATLTLLLMPLVVAMTPGVELNSWTAFVPLVNISLLIKALFLSEAKPDAVFLTLVSSVTYAMLAMLFAARAFGREQILLGGRASLRAVFRPERKTGALPTPGLALASFAGILVLTFYASLLLKQSGLVTSLLVTQYGFFLLPVAALTSYLKFPLVRTFSLRAPSWRGWLAALLIGVSAWAAIGGFVIRLLPPPESLVKALSKIVLLGDEQTPVWIAWLVVAITPAICEELLFRGLILSALRRLGNWPALIISSLLFAVAHASIYRLLPTFFLGLLLGYVVLRTRSIASSMTIHALNNGIAVALARYPALAGWLHLNDATFVPWSVTWPALAVLAIALLMLKRGPRIMTNEQ